MQRAIAFYARVSTSGQEKEETIKTQLAELKKAYNDTKTPIVVYKDVGSGAYLDRSGLTQLKEDIKRGLIRIVALYHLDRLSRNLGHQIALIEEFEKYGVKLEVLGEKYEDTPEGKLNRNIRGVFAEYERFRIHKRMFDGKMRKLNEGKLIGCYPSYGYTLVKKTDKAEAYFKINPMEAKVVRLIFRDYLKTNSITRTTKNLYNMGIKSRGGRGKKPSVFHKTTIRKILKNETYVGDFYYRKYEKCEAKYHIKDIRKIKLSGKRLRDKSEWKHINVPAIIDKKTFDKVQGIIGKNRREYERPAKHFYLCQGLIRCTHCKRKYTMNIQKPKGKIHLVYRCPQKYRDKVDEPVCRSRSMSVRKLDTYVWDYVSSLVKNADKVKDAIKFLQEKRESEKTSNQSIYDSLLREKEGLKMKKMRILDLYADNEFSKQLLNDKMSEIGVQEIEVDDQIKAIKKELQSIERLDSIEEEIERLCQVYKSNISNATNNEKRYIVKSWVKSINILDNGDIGITIKIPMFSKIPSKEELKLQFTPENCMVSENIPY